MPTDDEIKGRIIRKLFRRGNWGASHTSFENLKKGFTQRDTGEHGSKKVDKMGESLIKENLILSKPAGYGLEVSLNPKMIDRIQEYLDDE